MNTIGPKVHTLRTERRLSQAALAKVLGISQNYLSELEHGQGTFTAEHLLTLLSYFNVPVDYFAAKKQSVEARIQNALARKGAGHLLESSEVLPSEKLTQTHAVIRETLVLASSARQIAGLAPIFVEHADRLNFPQLRNEFLALGLQNRLGWALDSTLEALTLEANQVLSRTWRLKYRRAEVVIDYFLQPWRIAPGPPPTPGIPPQYDILDPEITSKETLKEVISDLSPVSRHWKIATQIEKDDFARALRAAREAH